MQHIERLADELWTSYLVRCLEQNGANVSDFRNSGYDNVVSFTENGVIAIERLVNMNAVKDKYLCFEQASLEERAFVSFPPEVEDQYDMEFLFKHDGKTKVTCFFSEEYTLKGLLSKYQHGKEYDSGEVIHDLVLFAIDPAVSTIEADY